MLIHFFVGMILIINLIRSLLTAPAARICVFYQDDELNRKKMNFICLHTNPGCFLTSEWACKVVSESDSNAKNPNIVGFTVTYHREWIWVKEGTFRPVHQ